MAITDPKLIEQYRHIHKTSRFGVSAHEFEAQIQACVVDLKPKVILEYGCGQSRLYQTLETGGANFVRYDPSIPALADLAIKQADLIINTDVLEHIPADDLDAVLGHMRSFGDKVFFNIATRPARRTLPNGENAHCTIWPADKWLLVLQRHFPATRLLIEKPGYECTFITWSSPPLEKLIVDIDRFKTIAQRERKRLGNRIKRKIKIYFEEFSLTIN